MTAVLESAPIEEQLRGADAVIYGTYNKQRYKRFSTGTIVTEHELRLISVAGIEQHDIIDKFHYKFYTLGGNWQGRTVRLEGVPQFFQGEEVVVFLKETSHGYFVHNLALGVYRIGRRGEDRLLINNAFSGDRRLSQMSFRQFEKHIEKRFGSGLYRIKKRYIYRGNPKYDSYIQRRRREFPGRNIASIYDREKKSGSSYFLWLTLVLVVLVLYSRRNLREK